LRFFNKNIYWIVLLLLLVGTAKHVYLLHDLFGFAWEISLTDGICTLALVAASLWGIDLLVKAYPTKVTVFTYSLIIAIALSFATVFAEWQLLKWWYKGDNTSNYYLGWLHNSMPIRFLFIWIFYSWLATNSALRKNINALNTRFHQQTDAAVLLRDAELFKLRQQLQPHFLYNSLNSISALVMISPERAQDMIGKLSDFLRNSVRREAEDKINIDEELLYIESYLAIESVRFGDRLKVSIEKHFDEGVTLPPFLLQPILENAIKFGLYSKTGSVEIIIKIVSDAPMLIITITNPYDPQTQGPRGTGFGLDGVGRRLYLLYSRTDLLKTDKDDNTFTTTLIIPQHHA
jgi:two-component system LytT family sensor kinase